MTDAYILDDDHHVVKVTLAEWARWWNFNSRRVALDETRLFEVSTVFLGLDHGWGLSRLPVLFETMVFEREAEIIEMWGKLVPIRPSTEQMRYCSWDDAMAGHQATLSRLRKVEADALAALTKTKAKKST